jgi:serine O-acetyltransferase
MESNGRFSMSLGETAISIYISELANIHFPDGDLISAEEIAEQLPQTLNRLETCMSGIHRKYFNQEGVIEFNHMNSDHMATFLYLLANTTWKATNSSRIPTKLFYLNKLMNSLDLFYSVELPEVFLLVHPMGSVIGNAQYGNYLAIYQGCTVGAVDGIYPQFGEGTILFAGSTVLGRTICGDNVTFAAKSFVINAEIPKNSVVTGSFPDHTILSSPRTVRERIFDDIPLQDIAES